MADNLSRLMGIVCGLAGLLMLAGLDVPVIRHGGYAGGFAAFELVAAAVILSAALGFSARE